MVGLDIIVPEEVFTDLPVRPIYRSRASRLATDPERAGQFS